MSQFQTITFAILISLVMVVSSLLYIYTIVAEYFVDEKL